MSLLDVRDEWILGWSLVCLLLWPLAMVMLGVVYRQGCAGQPHLFVYLLVFAAIWIFLFVLVLVRCSCCFRRCFDLLILVIWFSLVVLIVPGYVFIFDLRRRVRLSTDYPDDLCEQNFYLYSSFLIILVHIPLYIFLWISWSLTHSNGIRTNQRTSLRIFAITSNELLI